MLSQHVIEVLDVANALLNGGALALTAKLLARVKEIVQLAREIEAKPDA